jgi:ABC-type spermidine/putrescine transport system permease subunit II
VGRWSCHFARQNFRGRRLLFAIMLVSIMLPLHVIIVPQYVIFSQLGWINTLIPLVLPKFLATDAFLVIHEAAGGRITRFSARLIACMSLSAPWLSH